MIHPLLRLVATRPQLLADHVEAYAGLVGHEWQATASGWKRRALLYAIALCLLGVAIVLGGVALMLWAVMVPSDIHAPWALVAAPALPAAIALACVLAGQRRRAPAFTDLKQQLVADLAMLREVSAAC